MIVCEFESLKFNSEYSIMFLDIHGLKSKLWFKGTEGNRTQY